MMYWKYNVNELLLTAVLLCLAPRNLSCHDISKSWAVGPGEYPFLVLVEIQPHSEGSAEHVTGVLTSLSCVLTLSNALAQLPSGPPSSLQLRVYAGLTDLSQLVNSPCRDVLKITNKLWKENNKYFPNLVILHLEIPFQGSSMIRPVVFNVGMLSPRSTVVGWAHLPASNVTLSYAVAVRVIPRTSRRCEEWELVEFREQMCCYDLEPHPLRLSEGALLVDQHYLTAIKQFDTYLQSHLSTTVALFVRISYFMTWIQNVVSDPVPDKVFLQTKFDGDDITLPPRQHLNVSGSTVNHSSFCNCLLIGTVAVLIVYIQWLNN